MRRWKFPGRFRGHKRIGVGQKGVKFELREHLIIVSLILGDKVHVANVRAVDEFVS